MVGGFLSFLAKGFIGPNNVDPYLIQAPVTPPSVPADVAPVAPPPTDAPDTEFSLTDAANTALGTALSKQTVTRHGAKGDEQTNFPVAGVVLSPAQDAHHGRAILMSGGSDALPKGEPAQLRLKLSKPATDYTPDSLTAAVYRVLSAIPVLEGKIEAPTPENKNHYSDVWKALEPLLSTHAGVFTENERAMMAKYFDANKGKDDALELWGSAIEARHYEGKVHISVNARELPEDKTAIVSTDAGIVDYFNQHREALLAKVKEHVLALKKPDGSPVLTQEALADLEMHVQANGWGIGVTLGTKPPTDVDPATQVKWTDAERANKMTETPLANVDTKELGKIFSKALLECSNELPPIMPRMMDGPMLAGILRSRTKGAPDIEAFLSQHEMFKTEEQNKAETTERAAKGMIKLTNGIAGETPAGQPELSFGFELPPGLSFEKFQRSITGTKSQQAVLTRLVTPSEIGA